MIFMPYKSILVVMQAWYTLSSFRLGRIQSNVETAIIDGRAHIDFQREEIVFSEVSSGIEDIFRCAAKAGRKLELSEDQKFAACCPPGQKLIGTTDTAFDCCASGQELLGSGDTGYACCSSGQWYDGSSCKDQQLQKRPDIIERPGSGSGLIEGLCYRFASRSGANLAVNDNGLYTATDTSLNHPVGKFQLCKSEACNSGQPINVNDMIRIKDTQDQSNGRHYGNQWLDDGWRNSQIGKTDALQNAGIFSLSNIQLPPEHYCIGGANQGIDWINHKEEALTFKSRDKSSCIPFHITQVPCDTPEPRQECPLRDMSGRCIEKVGMNIVGPGIVLFPANFISADGPRRYEDQRPRYLSSGQYQNTPGPDQRERDISFRTGPITGGAATGGSATGGSGTGGSATGGNAQGGDASGSGCCGNEYREPRENR